MIRKTYTIRSWKTWDHDIHASVMAFHAAFGIYPNILLANPITLRRIDMAANRENIRGIDGELPEEGEPRAIGAFCGSDYRVEFAFLEKLRDQEVVLVYDDDPDGGGLPLPDEDTELPGAELRETG